MTDFTPSKIGLNSEILQLIESISRKQGELVGLGRSIHDDVQIETIAAIDAVHFSTKIEGNALTRDQVTQALQSKNKVRAPARELKEVLNYSIARRMVREWALKSKPIGDEWVLTHHAAIMKGIVQGKLRGHYREAQCVIKDSRNHAIVYMAPQWQDVARLTKGLLKWVNQQRTLGMSPLLLAAQFHFEFVTIHPFMDGNGRLARLLTNGILLSGGYNVERYAALEKQHEKDRMGYYKALRALQSSNYYDIPLGQDIRSWVHYWLKCLHLTYDEALSRITGSSTNLNSSLPFSTEERIKKGESLFRRHHKLRASQYADLVGVARTQAVADLNTLVEADVIERVGGGRSTVYKIRIKHGK